MPISKVLLDATAETMLDKAADCFDLAVTERGMAEKQHENATRQEDNAKLQQELADRQHSDADKLSAKAEKLDALGKSLVADAIEVHGETQIAGRGAA